MRFIFVITMSALCRNTKLCVTPWVQVSRRFTWRCSHNSWKKRPRSPARYVHAGVLNETVPCGHNFISKRHFQVSSSAISNMSNEDIAVNQIASASTADNVFVTLSSVDVLTPPHIIAAFGALNKLMLAQLMTQPWAISADPTMVFLQSLMNGDTKEIYDPVLQCPEFDRLCFEAQRCRSSFSNLELVTVTLHLTRMHVDLRSAVFTALIQECQVRHQDFDLETLVRYSEIANFMKRPGFILSAQIVNVLQTQWENLEMSEENFLNIIKLLHSVGYFLTKDTLFRYQRKMLELLKRYQDTVPPNKLIELLEALYKFSGRPKREIVDMSMLQFKNRLDEIDLWHLPRIHFQLMLDTTGNSKELLTMLSRRASLMLTMTNSNLRPTDVIALVRMNQLFTHSSSSIEALEYLLEDRMKDLDVLLLKYVSTSNVLTSTKNAHLVQAFCGQVQHRMKDLLSSLSCQLAVTHCLSKIPARPPEFDRVYSHHLMHHVLDHQLGIQPKHMATVGRFLVQCFHKLDTRLVGRFAGKIFLSLPRLTLIDIANVSLGINSLGNQAMRSTYEQIITNFAREILLRSDQIEDISVLNVLVKSVFIKLNGPFRDAIVDDLEELYMRLAPTLTLHSVKHTCHLLKHLRLRITVLCDRLVEIIIGTGGTTASLSDIAQVLDLLTRTNYRSSDLEAIQQLATKKILEGTQMHNSDMMDVLIIANSLASFQIFPEDVIKRVFSLNFLMGLDTLSDSIKSNSRKHHTQVYTLLSEINRSVMLQCPQLGDSVAWFCDSFSKPSLTKLDSNRIARWKSSLESGLSKALGGYEYVKPGPLLTPYNHLYDFECLLDENGEPLPFNTDREHIRYRVAVLLMTPSNYCVNTRILSGQTENKIAQMEILGFKVVAFPYSHLDSMMLGDPNSSRKFFYDTIVDQSN